MAYDPRLASIGSAGQDSFDLQIDKFLVSVEERCMENLKIFVLDLFSMIVMGTPIDTGRLARAWSVSLDESTPYKPGEGYNHKNACQNEAINAAQREMAKMDSKAMRARFPEIITIYNNMEYALPIEYGHSKEKSPHGMVRLAIAEMKSAFGWSG
jgi:hypothetical protein